MKKYYYLFLFTIIVSGLLLLLQFIALNKSNSKIIYNTPTIPSNEITKNSDLINSSEKSDYNNDYLESTCLNKVHITISEFINNQQYSSYLVKEGETLNDILLKYNSTCTANASFKLTKELNNLSSTGYIQTGMTLKVPEITLKNGEIYTINQGDSWSKICKKYYPEYDKNSIMELLIYINDLKSDILPLDTNIFLPKI